MKKIVYAKYNRTRKAKFQIGTRIFLEDGKKYVEKFALTEEAQTHIENLEKWSKVLADSYVNITFPTVVSCNGESVVFEYLEGRRLTDILSANMEDKESFLSEFIRYIEKLFAWKEERTVPFSKTEDFQAVFGEVTGLDGAEAAGASNIDMIPDNVFCDGDTMYLIDNEWGFDFPIPVEFIKYRALFYFYRENQQIKKWMSEEEFYMVLGINPEHVEAFQAMENAFQAYVHGEKFIDKYIQKTVPMDELKDSLSQAKNHVASLEEERKQIVEALEHYKREGEQLRQESDRLRQEKESYRHEVEVYKSQVELISKTNKDIIDQKNVYIIRLEAQRDEYARKIYYLKRPHRFVGHILKKIYHKLKVYTLAFLKKYMVKTGAYKKISVPSFEEPKVSIVIPVYNEFDYTYQCIQSIIDNVKNVSYEIIIGDDESTDTTKKIHKIIQNVKVNKNTTDHGFLMNCNRAAKLASGQYLVFLNNDTVVKENWLESLVQLIESDEKVGLVGSKLVYPDGRLQEAGGIIWRDASGWNYGREQNPDMPEYNYVRECDYISGASIMISKALWEEIGGFDERFKPAYCEDSDLAFEVRKRGLKVLYQPQSVVVHFEGVSNGTDLNAGLKKYQLENNIKFREKWAKELSEHYENAAHPFCARERNFGKKMVLFIDHYVPTYDKDAGSKTTFQYIKMFLSKGYIVKFIGDNYAQMEPYTTTLQQMGVEVLYGPWYAEHIFEWIEANQEYIDFVYLNRPHISIKYIMFLKEKTNCKLIYYGHDLHFLRMRREAELTGNEALLEEAENWKEREFSLMRNASMAYYPSKIEEDAIKAEDPDIRVKAITAYVYDEFLEDYQYNADAREGILFVGGFAHGPNVDAVKWFAEEVYPLIRKAADIPFVIVGSHAPEEIQALDGNGIQVKGFVSEEELASLYASCRMVVVPLRYGAGVKGKVVEAIYNGLPIVTTSVGAEGIEGVEDVLCVVDDAEEFAKNVVRLYRDKEELKAMANKTQEYIREHFSVDAVWNIVREDFS